MNAYILFLYIHINFLLFLVLSRVGNNQVEFVHIFNEIYKFLSYKADIRHVILIHEKVEDGKEYYQINHKK